MPKNKCTHKKGYLHVNIPLKKHGSNSLENISKLEMQLYNDKGISFDTGTALGKKGPKSRDWELDWSLEGAKPKTVLKYLKKVGIIHTIKKTCDSYA